MLRPVTVLGLLAVALTGLGCSGAIGDGGNSSGPNRPPTSGPGGGGSNPGGGGSNPGGGGSNPGGGGSTTVPTTMNPVNPQGLPSDDATVPGVAPLRKLTRVEYKNTIRDLLGVGEIPAARLAAISADQDSAGSGYFRGGSVTAAPDARALLQAAEDVATSALSRMGSLLPCNPIPTAAAAQDSCADQFLPSFGKRAYRRPLTDAEINDLKALYRAQRTPDVGADFPKAIANTIAAMLQSPWFLYHWELGPAAPIKEGNLIKFNQYELASKLSYLFWSSMPDDKLFEAADKNQLGNKDQIAEQARRLLVDVKARDGLEDFHLQWLHMQDLDDRQKDPVFMDWTPELAKAMLRETKEFVSGVFQGPKADGKLETLVTSKESFVDGTLAKLYGISGVTGSDLKPVTFKPEERAGLFTQGTFLATKADAIESHPIMRGDTVLAQLLCIKLEIPADLDVPPLPDPKPGQTTRERVSVHSSNPCASCHKMIDPIGFAFEGYDAIGKFRTTQEGKTVDASGTFPLGGATLNWKNAVEMVPQLAKSQEARDCMVTQWWRYAQRRQDVATEEPSIKMVREAFKQSNYDMRELLVAFTRSRAFAYRQQSPGEVLP
jgi:hypothetical protein